MSGEEENKETTEEIVVTDVPEEATAPQIRRLERIREKKYRETCR